MKVFRYIITLHYLKPIQIFWRIKRKFHHNKFFKVEKYKRSTNRKEFSVPILKENTKLGPNKYNFLNFEEKIYSKSDLERKNLTLLWKYNFHYFEDLNSKNNLNTQIENQNWLTWWVNEFPWGTPIAWDSYPISLRIVNWIKWSLRGHKLPDHVEESLYLQSHFLSQNLEYHLLGNHLFENAKALIFSGLFFKCDRAQRWLETGKSILAKEIEEQILSDGGHFELSPMYHSLVLEGLLDIINISSAYKKDGDKDLQILIEKLKSKSLDMLFWLEKMTHPDGEISFFNDSVFNVSPPISKLKLYAKDLYISQDKYNSERLTILNESGYFRYEKDPIVLIGDIAKVGPNYIPGHGHADTFSFELSIFGYRVFVNSGISHYMEDRERLDQRSTKSHNTVSIDNLNSSDVWKSFRVGKRASVSNILYSDNYDYGSISAQHDGFKTILNKRIHTRKWGFLKNSIKINDTISGKFHTATAFLFLHPQIKVSDSYNNSSLQLLCPNGKTILIKFKNGDLKIKKSAWHPEFGKSVPNYSIEIKFENKTLETEIIW